MTNTVLRPAGIWVNPDGLPVRFGKEAQVDAVVGAPTHMGDDYLYIADIDWSRLPKHQANDTIGVIYGNYPNAAIPAGALIQKAELQVTDPFTGTGAVLTLGLVTADGTEIDDNGLFTATDGAVANLDGTDDNQAGTGALIGTVLATTGYLWAAVTVADFTAGRGRLTITYFMPAPSTHDAETVS